MIIAITDAGSPAAIAQLKASGVAIRIIPHEFSLTGARNILRSVADALALSAEGSALKATFMQEWQRTGQQLKTYSSQPRVLFIPSHAGGGGH